MPTLQNGMTMEDRAEQVMIALMLESGPVSITRYHRQCQYHITVRKEIAWVTPIKAVETGEIHINWAASIYLGGSYWLPLRGGPCVSIGEADEQAKAGINSACDERG